MVMPVVVGRLQVVLFVVLFFILIGAHLVNMRIVESGLWTFCYDQGIESGLENLIRSADR